MKSEPELEEHAAEKTILVGKRKLIITNKSIFPRLKSNEVVVRFTFPGEEDSIRLTSVLPSQPGGRVVLPVLFYSSNLKNELSVRIFVENRNILLSAIGLNKI